MSRRLPSPSTGLRSTIRQLVSQPAVLISVSVLMTLAALGLSALPRSLELASRDDLHQTLTESPPARRNIAISHEHLHRAGLESDPLGPIQDVGRRFADQEMSAELRSLLTGQNMVIESPQFSLQQLPGGPDRPGELVYVDLRLQDDIFDFVELAQGRMPAMAEPLEVQFECPPPEDGAEEEECPPEQLPVIEVALTAETAAEAHLSLGDRALLRPDRRDPAWESVPLEELDEVRVVLEVTGIIEVADPDLDVWFGDRKLHFPRRVFLDLDTQWVEATALMSPDAYRDLVVALGGSGPPWWRYEWRYFVDSDAVARSDLAEFSSEVGRLRLAHSVPEAGSGAFVMATRLPELIEEHLAQRQQTLRLMALTIAGIVATVSFAVLALGVLMTERQREQLILTRDRGGSAPQVTLSRTYQALLMTVPPAAVAFGAATALFGDTSGQTPYAIVLVLTVAAVAALVLPVVGIARRPLGALRAGEPGQTSNNPRRKVFELALVFLAVACVILVRRRDPAATTGLDWLLVATPAVVGAAVGVLALRLAGPLASGLAWLSSRGRGAVSFLSFRRAVRQPMGTRIPLAVLVVCMATASLSVITLRAIETGQEAGSWQAAGADFTITSAESANPLSTRVTPESLGTDEIVYGATSATRATLNQQRGSITLWAIDADRHQEVFAGTPGDLGLESLTSPTPKGELAAVVSDTWINRLRPQVGHTVTVTIGDSTVTVEIVAVRPTLPGIDPHFVVVDKEGLEALLGTSIPPTQALVRGPRSLEARITEVAADTGSVVASRYTELDRLAQDPMVRWTVQGMTAGWLMAAAVGALAIVAALALGAATRRRDLGFLKTMGLENRDATLMTLIEQVPGVALATALGLATGAATLVAIRSSLDLGVLTGQRSTPITIDWGLLGAVFAVALALLAAAGVIFVLVNRRQDLGRALRVGDE